MSVVVISAPTLFAVALTALVLAIAAAISTFLYFSRQRRQLQAQKEAVKTESRAELMEELIQEMNTAELPTWKRTGGLYDDPTPTLSARIIKREASKDHYPFSLPNLHPMTPLPDVMKEPARINRVVMRANDWVESRDQYGFVMPEFSGLWNNVNLSIMTNYDGEWLVPQKKTGFHQIIRFKKVRPQDYPMPPIRHPRELPEVSQPRLDEMSPIF